MRIKERPGNIKKDPLESFLGNSSVSQIKQQIDLRSYPREALSALLVDYNREIGNDALSLQNAQKLLEPSSYCVVTGQQLGMMGGPIYTILKGMSCLLAAREHQAIPIFWLATEDHDIHEIDHTYLIDDLGNLKRFHLSLASNGSPVEKMTLSQKNLAEINAFWSFLGVEDPLLPISGESYAQFMCRVLVRLFSGTGMVFLEPKLLRPLAGSFFQKEINEHQVIRTLLKTTTEQLLAAGGNAVIDVDESTNLFFINKSNKRQKIRTDGDGFKIGQEHISLKELLSKIEKEPEAFSCNVAARPVLQNFLLPVIAYIAGPSEMDYYRQLLDYHHFHNTSMPCLIPRLSATFIPPSAAAILEACHLEPWQEIPDHWPDVMPELEEGSEWMKQEWQQSAVNHFEKDLSPSAIDRYVKNGAKKLVHRVIKNRLHKKDLPGNGLHLLRNLLFPHQQPQERVLNWWGFQANKQENLLKECLKQLTLNNPQSHYYIYL